MAEVVDAADSKSVARKGVLVQVRPGAPIFIGAGYALGEGGAARFKLVKGKCQRITANEPAQGCPPGTKPVPETDNCVPITTSTTRTTPTAIIPTKKSGCAKGQIKIDGQCVAKQDAASFCGPGYRLQGKKCVQGYAAPAPQAVLPTWQLKAIKKGCSPGQNWNAAEGCHEND